MKKVMKYKRKHLGTVEKHLSEQQISAWMVVDFKFYKFI